jgi:hypothetical protein
MAIQPKLLNKEKASDWLDQMAAQALVGVIAGDAADCLSAERVAKISYELAQAMWEERNRPSRYASTPARTEMKFKDSSGKAVAESW